MTIKDLQRIILSSGQQLDEDNSPDMERLKSLMYQKHFYQFNEKMHSVRYRNSQGNCCFWHIVGAPRKDGHDMPLLPYQRLLYEALREHKHIWIKKSRGLGVTTFFLYWIAYRCLTKFQPNDRVCIIVGPNINSAEDFLTRFKNLFTKIAPGLFDKSKSTVAILNRVRVEVFPSHHVSSMRGLDKVRLVLSDESDYYPPFQQKEVRAVVEGYIGKPNSDPHMIFVSTPAAPGGLMQTIELEQNSLYYKHFFDYNYGLEGPQPIYSERQLVLARKSPDWSREYEGKYAGLIGNVYSNRSIERVKKLGQKYETYANNPDLWKKDVPTVIALDPAWGLTSNASKYGVVVSQFIDGKAVIIFAANYSKPDFSDMVSEIWRLHSKCGHISNIIVDSAKPEVISTLRREFRKDQYSEQVMRNIVGDCKKYNTPIENRLFVVPKSFAVEGRQMLQHSIMLMDDPDGLVAIPSIPRHESLLIALKTANATEWKLDKQTSLNNDLTDAFIMNLSYYRMSK